MCRSCKSLCILILALNLNKVTCENEFPEPEDPRYAWFPDSNGTVHLVDLKDETPPENRFMADEDIAYYVYTRRNPQVAQRIYKGDRASLAASYFNKRKPVKLTIHGWTGDTTSPVNVQTRIAFLHVLDVNVIIVDWSKGSGGGYSEAVKNCVEAGASIGDFLDWLNQVGVPFKNIHVIGHSLGGQLAGFVCRACRRGRVAYLTSLDPAHPSWDVDSDRIRKTDAEYVEVIHTNTGRFGMTDPAGHNDFYPNGGLHMPGCAGNLACSHARCVDYFAESIDHQWFMGNRCETVSEAASGKCPDEQKLYMGGARVKAEFGIFALETNADSPYYKG